jgi:hypothetical protein
MAPPAHACPLPRIGRPPSSPATAPPVRQALSERSPHLVGGARKDAQPRRGPAVADRGRAARQVGVLPAGHLQHGAPRHGAYAPVARGRAVERRREAVGDGRVHLRAGVEVGLVRGEGRRPGRRAGARRAWREGGIAAAWFSTGREARGGAGRGAGRGGRGPRRVARDWRAAPTDGGCGAVARLAAPHPQIVAVLFSIRMRAPARTLAPLWLLKGRGPGRPHAP